MNFMEELYSICMQLNESLKKYNIFEFNIINNF